ncbi:hypothetical protein EON63_05185 [archaeon]|nr:MAG: hypothetical protein EON63_05185 [archaeon]
MAPNLVLIGMVTGLDYANPYINPYKVHTPSTVSILHYTPYTIYHTPYTIYHISYTIYHILYRSSSGSSTTRRSPSTLRAVSASSTGREC